MGLLKSVPGLLKTAPVLALLGCGVADGPSPALLTEARVIAIQAEPAEAAPGEAVVLTATIAGGDLVAPPSWTWCATPKPPTENNSVAPACLDGGASIATGTTTRVTLPGDGCRLFGPESPGPGLRPRDPDITGGYYQPAVLHLDAARAVGLVRLRCNLSQAPLAVAQRFAAEYTPNRNPSATLTAAVTGPRVRLRVETDPPEQYLRFDLGARALVEQTESLTVAWFVPNGRIANPRSVIRDEAAEVEWVPDALPATAFAVVRDARGGVAVDRIEVSAP